MTLQKYQVLTTGDASEVEYTLRDIIRTRENDITEYSKLQNIAENNLGKKLLWAGF